MIYGNTICLFPPGINSFTPSTACSGSTVTITGTNLSAATAVKFGGTDAVSLRG